MILLYDKDHSNPDFVTLASLSSLISHISIRLIKHVIHTLLTKNQFCFLVCIGFIQFVKSILMIGNTLFDYYKRALLTKQHGHVIHVVLWVVTVLYFRTTESGI